MAEHILTNCNITLTHPLISRMLDFDQKELIYACIVRKARFDKDIKSSRLLLSGHVEESLDEKILLSDFVFLMLEKRFPFRKVRFYLHYLRDFINHRELFVLFAIRRKVRLMSYLLHVSDFQFQFAPHLLLDVLANDAYDIGVLLYREFFLSFKPVHGEKVLNYLINSLRKNGMLEAKVYLFKRMVEHIQVYQALKLFEVLE